uniref:Uncharacterized protein n=1 Tax=Tanacetum cinerariifolium TaxID=118510 RepID=A0A6L2JL68_TANCI|nr:hypothetical protein [Tanacetum cinerariifolium]
MIVAQQVDEGVAEVNVDDVPIAGVADEGAASVNVDVVLTAIDEPTIPSPPPPTQPPQPSQDIPSTSQDAKISMDLLHNLLDTCTTLTRRVENLEQDKIAQALEITKVDTSENTVINDASKQGGIIANIDADEGVTLKNVTDKEVAVDAKIEEITAASATITAAAPTLTTVVAPTLTVAPSAARRRKGVVIRDPKETEEPKLLKKQAQIEQDEAYVRELETELNKNIDWDEVIKQVQRKEKEDNVMMRNMVGFKMDYCKGIKYDDIRPIFEKYFNSHIAFLEKTREQMEEEENKALKRINESQDDKAAKKQKLDEEVKELRKHL